MLSIVVEAAIRSLTLGCIAGAILACFRVKNPITRLTVWTGMLYVAVAMPVLVVVRHALLPALPVLPAIDMPPLAFDPILAMPQMAAPIASGPAAALPAGAAETAVSTWPSVLLMLYVAVALFLLLRLGSGLARGWALRRRAVRLEDGLYLSGEVTSPVVFGSAIILPEESSGWSDAKRAAVLAHERSHIARGDFHVQLLSGAHRAIFCFSPLGWWLHRELARLAELASDDEAAHAHGDRLAYAEILIEVARDARPMAGAVAMARGPEISGRIKRMVSGVNLSIALSHRQRAMIGGVGALVVLGALSATAATSGAAAVVAKPGAQKPQQSRFAPMMATLAKIDDSPARLAKAIGALLQGSATPALAAEPQAAATPPVPELPEYMRMTVRQVGAAGQINSMGGGWGSERLIRPTQEPDVPTLGELKSLSPPQAGERMLGGLKHGTVSQVSFLGTYGPARMMEEWTRVPQGCQRLDWTGYFLLPAHAPPDNSWVNQVSAVGQVALAEQDGCANARYALLGFRMTAETGFRTLAMLDDIAKGRRTPALDCTSESGRDLCTNMAAFRAELLRPVHRLINWAEYPPPMTDPNQSGAKLVIIYNSVLGGKVMDGGVAMYMKMTFDPRQPDRLELVDMKAPSATGCCAVAATRPPPPPPPLPLMMYTPEQLIERQKAAGPPSPALMIFGKNINDDAEQIRQLTPLAENGDVMATFLLGNIYNFGRNNVPQDIPKAMAYLRQAAEKGDGIPYAPSTVSAAASERLAMMYEMGMYGVARDNAEAAIWWRRLAKTGDPRGPLILAQRGLEPLP